MKLYFFIILGCFAFHIGKTQQIDQTKLKVQYTLEYVKDTLAPDKKTQDIMLLKVGSKLSYFYSYTSFMIDSLMQHDMANGLNAQELLMSRKKYGKRGLGYHLYTNYPVGSITYVDKIVNNFYQYTEKVPTINWSILPDKDVHLGYPVQKATCRLSGRDYIAWFTADIPVSYGPWKFSGLPGLIVKVEDTQHHFSFTMTGLSQPKQINSIEWINKASLTTTKEKFASTEKKYAEDPIRFINTNTGMTTTLKSGNLTKSLLYNPIEKL